VIWGWPLDRVMAMVGIAKDFDSSRGLDTDLAWLHRHDGGTEIYYVANLADHPEDLTARFRVSDKEAELWHPLTGEIESASYALLDGRTTVPLRLDGHESVFVVFRHAAASPSRQVTRPTIATVATIGGPWRLTYPAEFGGAAPRQLPALVSWTELTDEPAKYFSGSATYAQTVSAPATWFRDGATVWLDLGDVRDLASVSVNGRSLGLAWKPAYRFDVTNTMQPGENQLEIRVTNQWTNRLLGDQQVPPERRVLNSDVRVGTFRGNPADLPLPASGLLGPVTVLVQTP